MLSEEAFILVVVGGACVLLVLGVLELLWPTKPRYHTRHAAQPAPRLPVDDDVAPVRPEPVSPEPLLQEPVPPELQPLEAPPRVEMPTPTETLPEAEAMRPPPEVLTPPEVPLPRRQRRSKVSPHARAHRVLRGARKTHGDESAAPMVPERAPAQKVEAASRGSFWTSAGLPEPVAEARAGRDSPLVETCFAMYQEKRFGEVVVRAEEALADVPEELSATASHETAALWAVLALAKQALGDDEGAGLALASAIEIAPETE